MVGGSCGRGKVSRGFLSVLDFFFGIVVVLAVVADGVPYGGQSNSHINLMRQQAKEMCPPPDPDYDLMHKQHKNCIKRNENYATHTHTHRCIRAVVGGQGALQGALEQSIPASK